MTTARLVAAAGIAGIAGIVATAVASQEITLKVTHTYPANHYLIEHGFQVLLDQVERETEGQIKFEVYPAGQLGRDHLGNLDSGMAHLAFMSPSVESAALVLSTVGELPGAYSTACEGAGIVSALMEEGGMVDREELSERGIRFLYAAVFPQYTLFSGPKPFTSIDDISGMKVRAGGAAISKSFRLLGAVPIQIPGGEMYDSLKRGIVDAAFWPEVAVPAYDLQEVMSSAIVGTDLGGATNFVGINKATWDGLSDEHRQIFTEAAAAAQKNFCEWIEGASQEVLDNMVEENGLELTVLTDEQRGTLQEKLASVRSDWAAEMEAAGKPGTEVLEAWEAARSR